MQRGMDCCGALHRNLTMDYICAARIGGTQLKYPAMLQRILFRVAGILIGAGLAVCLSASARAAPAWPDAGAGSQVQTGQHSRVFDAVVDGRRLRIAYWLFVPASYPESAGKWPLLLFLHGSREAGGNIDQVRRAVLPQLVDWDPNFPFIVVSPQSPTAVAWDSNFPAIVALLDDLQSRLSIDPDRVYLTGLSLGGFGALALAVREPDRFAAVVPVVGGYYSSAQRLCALKNIPTWVFHGKRDANVPFRQSQRVVDALRGCGGNPRFTVYDDADHDEGWRRAYAEPALYDWLLEQRRPQPAAFLRR